MKPLAFVLLGPTASGKSPMALELAGRFPIEIVSVDSGQVYRGLNIGTAKPTAAEQARVPHHLIDLIEPTESYSAGKFRDDAVRAITGIVSGWSYWVVGGALIVAVWLSTRLALRAARGRSSIVP